MYITTELLLQIVPALEEVDKAMSTAAAADQIMIGQTDILFTMGFQDKSLMQAGFQAYNTALGGFKTDMMGIVSGFQKGTYTYTQAMDRWDGITKDHYIKMFSAGTKAIGNPFYEKMGLTQKDLSFINGARRLERRFMSKLLMDIENPNHVPKFRFPKGHPYAKLPPYLQRGLAYAESGKAQFMNGMLAGAGSRMDIYWVLGVPQLEHCDVCPVYASRKWTWQSLPTVPRAGGTPCLFRCYCILEFKPRSTARGFDLAGKATEGALRAPGKQGRVFDSTGREMGGELQRRVEDAYARMYKARQMMLATKGEARMEWVRARIAANREIIEITAPGNYRTVPTVSVRALTETMKSAMAKGGTLIDDIMTLGVGDEITLVSGDFSAVGTVAIRGGRLIYKGPSGIERVIESETDIVFALKKEISIDTGTSFPNPKDAENFINLCKRNNSPVPIKVISPSEMGEHGGEGAFGAYDPRDKTLYLSSKWWAGDLSKADDFMRDMIRRDIFSKEIMNRLDYALQHEIGHARSNLVLAGFRDWVPKTAKQLKAVDDYWYASRMGWDRDPIIIKEMGRNAAWNRAELLADVYAMWKTGGPLTKEMKKLIKDMGWK